MYSVYPSSTSDIGKASITPSCHRPARLIEWKSFRLLLEHPARHWLTTPSPPMSRPQLYFYIFRSKSCLGITAPSRELSRKNSDLMQNHFGLGLRHVWYSHKNHCRKQTRDSLFTYSVRKLLSSCVLDKLVELLKMAHQYFAAGHFSTRPNMIFVSTIMLLHCAHYAEMLQTEMTGTSAGATAFQAVAVDCSLKRRWTRSNTDSAWFGPKLEVFSWTVNCKHSRNMRTCTLYIVHDCTVCMACMSNLERLLYMKLYSSWSDLLW